jgi:hypothetical protein
MAEMYDKMTEWMQIFETSESPELWNGRNGGMNGMMENIGNIGMDEVTEYPKTSEQG